MYGFYPPENLTPNEDPSLPDVVAPRPNVSSPITPNASAGAIGVEMFKQAKSSRPSYLALRALLKTQILAAIDIDIWEELSHPTLGLLEF